MISLCLKKQWFLRFQDGCLDLEIKLMFMGVRWLPKLTLGVYRFILDTFVKNRMNHELKLEKDGTMSLLIYECWTRLTCIVCINFTSIKYMIRNLKLKMWLYGHVWNVWDEMYVSLESMHEKSSKWVCFYLRRVV